MQELAQNGPRQSFYGAVTDMWPGQPWLEKPELLKFQRIPQECFTCLLGVRQSERQHC